MQILTNFTLNASHGFIDQKQ